MALSFLSQFFEFDSEVTDAVMGLLMPECSSIHSVDFVFSSPPPPPPPPPLSWPESGETVRQIVSPQSVAARERRKKISTKTQELGRLIPGGEKMSTADMLVAAHKYVRFLQAEESVLQYMNEQKVRKGEGEELLQVLLASPKIQERLSSEGKCLVPKEMVDDLVAKHLIVNN
ncbi:transcription factor bHLH52-like [Dendrobium catenatum]|uniref:Transcription factor bHLH52 n=1 Tax=Dendrobium catenatum TaxID=906689 RepID=A0A2I0WPB3_9ASPA|nr:transcription factor bHLH52-like [Dendrobium catenatum]PKU77502.1 Transcription factor bHLH52 [Dendrobium catenatum]